MTCLPLLYFSSTIIWSIQFWILFIYSPKSSTSAPKTRHLAIFWPCTPCYKLSLPAFFLHLQSTILFVSVQKLLEKTRKGARLWKSRRTNDIRRKVSPLKIKKRKYQQKKAISVLVIYYHYYIILQSFFAPFPSFLFLFFFFPSY